MGYIPSTKKNRARRVDYLEYKLDSGGSRYKLDSGWDSGRYREWKFFLVVWDGAIAIGSVSKTKTRHNIVFVFFFSNPGWYVKHTPERSRLAPEYYMGSNTHTTNASGIE